MKKMTKGAIVTGLGVALLLGGGGTLAVWNADTTADIGIVTAGDLDLDARPGVWTSSLTGVIGGKDQISAYRIIPGETLTYSQKINVTLVGNSGLKANLTVEGIDAVTNGFGGHLQNVSYAIKDASNKLVVDQGKVAGGEVAQGAYTASAAFTFTAEDDQARNVSLNLSPIKYQLTQVAPAQANGTPGR